MTRRGEEGRLARVRNKSRLARAKAGHTWSPPHGHGQGAFGWPPSTALCPDLPRSFSPSVSHHLEVSLRAWRVARSWHRLSTEICWPVCWAWPRGPGLSPDSMVMPGWGGVGWDSATPRVVPQGQQMGSPGRKPHGRAVLLTAAHQVLSARCFSVGGNTPAPSKGSLQKHRWLWEDFGGKAGAMGLLLGLGTLSQTYPSVLGAGGLKKTWRACAYTEPEAKEVRHPAPTGPRRRQGQVSPPATCGPQGWTLKTNLPRGQQTL